MQRVLGFHSIQPHEGHNAIVLPFQHYQPVASSLAFSTVVYTPWCTPFSTLAKSNIATYLRKTHLALEKEFNLANSYEFLVICV